MSRAKDAAFDFDAITIEGGLLPADWLAKVAALVAPQQSAADYGIPKGLTLRDELGRYWRIAQAHWQDFTSARDAGSDGASARLIPNLLRDVFGAADFESATAPAIVAEHGYPIAGFARGGRLPVAVAPHTLGLDQRDRRFGDAGRQRSAFGLLQDYLNAEDAALWGLASNGNTLRLARDNVSLTRPAWIEADLERIFTEDRFADFSLLWLLIHASRFGSAAQLPQQCALEAWREASREQGTRAREHLRDGVETALKALGQGFLAEPANSALRQRLANGDLTPQAYFGQLLRLVYRFIFVLTIEERGLLHPHGANPEAIKTYTQGYGLKRLRERARRRRAWDRQRDLWLGLKPVFAGLADGQPLLALPALGGLFASDQCPDLDSAELGNAALLQAIFQLGWLRQDGSLARINWRDMGPEELGSIYESLLELVPDIGIEARRFAFASAEQSRGNERKQTGSYYTPDPLVQELLDSALEPVIAQRLAGADDPQAALLTITVCDPACGSGHFLLAAARRLATRLAQLRAGGTPSGEDYRHALRDVIGHCIFGVDRNPMALELARMSLWLEAMTPDKPLGFLDHHLQCGDALLGVLDLGILDQGIPDDAFKALTGDDKTAASDAKKLNKIERESWKDSLGTGDLFQNEHLASSTDAVEHLDDDDLAAVAAKGAAWRDAQANALQSRLARLADLYVGAFLLPKTSSTRDALPSSRHLWAVANGQSVAGLDAAEAAAQSACTDARVFHWWLAFPQVHAGGGFTLMLGNPPWERIKLQEQEFFSAQNAAIATAPTKAERTRLIGLLAEGRLQQTLDDDEPEGQSPSHAEKALYASFEIAKRTAEASSAFVHVNDGRYPLTGRGDVDTYALFAETFAQLRSAKGRAGIIVKSGICTDDTYKVFFQSLVASSQLVSLRGFDNTDRIFPAVHVDTPFALVTIGATTNRADICHYILAMAELAEPRRHFSLTSEEFALLNPNTYTSPVFRSQRDAELTKAIYRRVPVLIHEAVKDGDGKVVEPEVNPWRLSNPQNPQSAFQTIFHMSNDSGLFRNAPGPGRLPLYEGKMIHQFDHRWGTYVEMPDGSLKIREGNVTVDQKRDPDYRVQPEHWVDEAEVLARIACVPRVVAKGWLVARQTSDPAARAEAFDALWLALAQWIAAELFRREAGESPAAGYSGGQRLRSAPRVESRLAAEFPACAYALLAAKVTARKAATEIPKWALRDADTPLADEELATLRRHAAQSAGGARDDKLLSELDDWMHRRSPRWLMGWRDITNATNERTVIVSVIPRVAVNNKIPLIRSISDTSVQLSAALLGNLCSLALDFVARQKLGGTTLNYFYMKQFPVLPPDRYTDADVAFIVPRVLELTYTAHDLADWARDLGHSGPPFAWEPDRRAQLRAELDAYYAHLYGLDRDELRYILDPADVMGADYPSETFRVLKNNELRAFGKYRTHDLVLNAWDALQSGRVVAPELLPAVPIVSPSPFRRRTPLPAYVPTTTPCCEAEDWLAGLACDVLLRFGPAPETDLRMILTTPMPSDVEYADTLADWTIAERISRLPAIADWFRKLFELPVTGDLRIPGGADLSTILGDPRTGSLATSLIEAHKARQRALAQALQETADTQIVNGLQDREKQAKGN